MFGPLNFKDLKPANLETGIENVECLLCSDIFNLILCFDRFLLHLFEVHHIVVEEVQHIDYLEKYLRHWKNRFVEADIESLIPNLKVDETGIKYFLLSTLLKEDNDLRQKLSLEKALNTHAFERNDQHYLRQCLFCKLMYEGDRKGYVKHLSEQHNLQLGNPQNLVYVDELIEHIDVKLNELKCIFCEKTFTDRPVLKEHMRKKLHKRVNPADTSYDKYYIVNYLECKEKQKDRSLDILEPDNEQNSDLEYSDWCESDVNINCLFCKHTEVEINKLCQHMNEKHLFDFKNVTEKFDFYQKIKLVNYIRRQIYKNLCVSCNFEAKDLNELNIHLSVEKHCQIPEISVFDQPEYYFPTYENDTFLYLIEDVDE